MEIPKTNTKITLTQKSKKGKDRINEQGNKWIVEAVTERVLFDSREGPWLGLRAVKNKEFFRWVHLTNDDNFEVSLMESEKDKDLFEDFTTLRWVKWTKRKPTHNGSVYMRFNGKNAGIGFVFQGELKQIDGLSEDHFQEYEETFYWLEETIKVEKYSKYRNSKEKK